MWDAQLVENILRKTNFSIISLNIAGQNFFNWVFLTIKE